VSNRMRITTSGEAAMRFLSTNPYPDSDNQVLTAKPYNFANGTKHRIIAKCDENADNYYYAEWHYVDSSNMYWRICKATSGGGADQELASVGPDTPISEGQECKFYATDGGQFCMEDISSRLTACDDPPLSGKYPGLGSGGVANAEWDDFEFEAHKQDDPECPVCDCSCNGHCIPDELTATVEEVNECPDFDDYSWTLDHDGQETRFGSEWNHTAFSCDEDIEIKLSCSSADNLGVENILLDIVQGSFVLHADSSASDIAPDSAASGCDPIALRYGPFSYGSVSGCAATTCCNGNPCGTDADDESLFYIWITE